MTDTIIGCLQPGPRHANRDVNTPESSDSKQDGFNGRSFWLNRARETENKHFDSGNDPVAHPASTLLFFTLPRELREQIYDYALDGVSIKYQYGIALITASYGESGPAHSAFFSFWMHTNRTLLLEASEQFHRHARFMVDFNCDPFAKNELQHRTKPSSRCLPSLEFARYVAIEGVTVKVCYPVVDDPVFKAVQYQRLTLQTVFRHTASIQQLRIRLATYVTLEQKFKWRSEYTRSLTLLDAGPQPLSALWIERDISVWNRRVASYDRQSIQRYPNLAQALGKWSEKVMCDSVQGTDIQERRWWFKEKKEGLEDGYLLRKRTLTLENSTTESRRQRDM
jgi:hypothetical protein